MSLKEEVEKKHQCLQNAYEQLYVDYNQAQDKVVQLESKLVEFSTLIRTETVDHTVQTNSLKSVDKHIQTNDLEMEENESTDEQDEGNVVGELTKRVKNILKSSFVEIEPDESIFEALAKQYIDVKWTKDVVESETEWLHEEVKRLQVENSALRKKNSLRKKNAMLRSTCPNETRLKNQGQSPPASRTRKSAKLENIPEDIEDTFNTMENLNRRLHTTLDENDKLRKKIDLLENTEKETQEQLRISLEKCKYLDENIEFVEELKFDLENVRRELKTSVSNGKQLENSLAILRGMKDEIQKENEELSRRNEQLEIEISQWRESNSETGNNDTLKDLQEQLAKTNREKDDLDYDILNMRKELDEAFNQIELKESYIAKLSQENESLTKEKISWLEQLTAIQDESNDKLDLVNTEKSLLEQEQMELKEKVANNKKVINEIRERLRESEERYVELKSEFLSMNKTIEKLQLEKENLQNEIKKREELKSELELSELTEKLCSMQNDYAQMENKIETLRLKERELIKLQESFATVAEENKTLKTGYEVARDSCIKLEHDIACLQAEKKELLNRINENVCDKEKQQITAILEEKIRENDTLKDDNSKLMAEIINSQKKLQKAIDENTESADMAKETIENLSHLIREKDEEINNLKSALYLAKTDTETLDFATIKNERDELVKLVTIKHNENVQYHDEIQRLTHLLNEQTSRGQNLLTEEDLNVSELKDIATLQHELQAVEQRLRNAEESNSKETCGIVEHSTQTTEIAILNEKCNALEAALIQEQSNNRMLQNQLNESQGKEANAGKELERLRAHLVEMESSYTEDALLAEETRKELEVKLQQAEEKMKSSSNAYTSASIRANQQVETLQQQMALIVQQRDDIQNKLAIAEDKILSQTTSLTNLQIVLEQFQRGNLKYFIISVHNVSYTKLSIIIIVIVIVAIIIIN